MRKLRKLQLTCVAMMALLCVSYAYAFSPSIYATRSKLSMGNWVKISIPESGIYEITYDELLEMGFSNPLRVHIYGVGGNAINEKLNGSFSDDLKAVPILRTNDKICFYGNGPVSFTMSNYSTLPHYTRTFNPYSQVGCYFLTEEYTSDVTPTKKNVAELSEYVSVPTSMNYFYHERELWSVASSGKDVLGEGFSRQSLKIDYYLPHLADSAVVVHSSIAASAAQTSYAMAVMHSGGVADTLQYDESISTIHMPLEYVFYNEVSPYESLKLSVPAERGQYEPLLRYTYVTHPASLARLDYVILTYTQNNILANMPDNQMIMGFAATNGKERFELPGASSSTVVWYINNTKLPMVMTTYPYDDESGTGLAFFSAPISNSTYVAFDPSKTLKKISGFEPVANQNLHGMSVPDFLIITTDAFLDQANRLADLHRAVDGIDVAVVTQDQVFNEFSSGTRDAMAYRLLCKMLYDRDNSKFKNLLLFGTGSYDNRELFGSHPDMLLTFQSDISNELGGSYTSDDFFGFLEDNSGISLGKDKLSIGVGRITCTDAAEARSDVDKIVEYYGNPDYGVWRNHTIVSSDSPDNGEYLYQGQGYQNQIDNDLNTGMHVNTVHNSMYPRSTVEDVDVVRKTATEANRQLNYLLRDGAYFATYVGHAGSVSLTKYNKMWTTSDVLRTSYPHYPIMSLACCDVAHFDNEMRGIAETMLHKRDGGAIALLASTRMVMGDQNDRLNQYFINALFSYDSKGVMPTLGEAYKQSKLGFTTANPNKLSFCLLGDPAMKINYPISRFNITSVNGTDMTDTTSVAGIRPLSKFEINAQVVDADGNIDTGFNGDATVILYDREYLFTTLTGFAGFQTVEREIYMDRPKLAEISGRVVNGLFTGTMIAPRIQLGRKTETLMMLLRVYAHKDNSDYMVNGFTKQVEMLPYDESQILDDNEPPVIEAMYLNDAASFTDGAVVSPDAMLYINVHDNECIDIQANSASTSMKLQLDGGKRSYSDVTSNLLVSDGGRAVAIQLPLSNLTEGVHTLTYLVYDMLGNSATRTISFMVGQYAVADLSCDKSPAYVNGTVSFDVESESSLAPDMMVRVTDATGNLVWKSDVGSFPITWDMKDMNGKKVPAGLYRYYGTYYDGKNYGGTPLYKLIVLDPVKTAPKNQLMSKNVINKNKELDIDDVD